jgi:TPR repeat protein
MQMTDQLMDNDELRSKEPRLEELSEAQALVSTDFSAARQKFEELVNQGSVMAMVYLAFAHSERGEMEQAKSWYRKAYQSGSSNALFCLATILYHEGDVAEAERLWSDGVSKNDAPSMFPLAVIYLESLDEDKNCQARMLLEKGHDLGQFRATQLLARRLATGKYGISNVPRGVFLFLKFLFSGFLVAHRDPNSRRLW